MRTAYKILAIVVAAQVVIQSMAMVFAVAGQGKWVMEGGVLDAAVIESRAFVFPEVLGYAIHGMVGTMIIPLTALILLICSFFTKIPGAVKWAALVLLLVVAQVALGVLGHDIPVLGALHGLNALLLFSAAIHAARLARNAGASQAVDPEARLAPRT
ncbi:MULTISPECIES: hypothetical protein [Nonomuraea]|uniref:Uncharacterized protein n=1 Tax=Nonomuraea mangrovi TaxID=2316207 RepID=A0ABW4SNQ4_9ACTN